MCTWLSAVRSAYARTLLLFSSSALMIFRFRFNLLFRSSTDSLGRSEGGNKAPSKAVVSMIVALQHFGSDHWAILRTIVLDAKRRCVGTSQGRVALSDIPSSLEESKLLTDV